MKTIICSILMLLVATAAQAASVQTGCNPNVRTQSKTVVAKAGDTIIIFNPGNPTTGYEWISKEGLKGTYNDMSRGAVGSGGAYQFALIAKHKDDGKVLTFEYKRAWETDPISVCKIKIGVN